MSMDISQNIYIWVTDAEPFEDGKLLLDGISFDGYFGFGDENCRSYAGQLLMISDNESMTSDCGISTIHLSRNGYKWVLESNTTVTTPFLLTNNLTLKNSYYGSVSASLTDFSSKVFERDVTGAYPVIASNFIGILQNDNFSLSLIAFSAEDSIIPYEKVFFSEWEKELGIVKGFSDSNI